MTMNWHNQNQNPAPKLEIAAIKNIQITCHFILLNVPRRYFRVASLCLLVFVSVSVLFSPSVCLDDI